LKSLGVSEKEHEQVMFSISELLKLDVLLKKSIIETRHGFLKNFDAINDYSKQLSNVLQINFNTLSQPIHNALEMPLSEATRKISERQNTIYKYVSRSAIYNSFSASFPQLCAEFKSKIDFENNQLLLSQIDAILLSLAYEKSNKKVLLNLEQLQHLDNRVSDDLTTLFNSILIHGNLLIKAREEVNELQKQIFNNKATGLIEKVGETYRYFYNKQEQDSLIYKRLIILVSFLMIVIVIISLYRLERLASTL